MIGSPDVDVTGLTADRRPRAGAARRRLADLSRRCRAATLSDLGEVPERLNGHDWKSCVGFTVHRGFESLPLR